MKAQRLIFDFLIFVYVLIIADFIASICWGGFAQTGSGLAIPDSSLILPVVIFLIATVFQAVYNFAKDKKSIAVNITLIVLKALFVLVCLWMTSNYAFNVKYYSGSDWSDFYSNAYNTVIVAVFLALVIISTILEFAGAVCIFKRQKKEEI